MDDAVKLINRNESIQLLSGTYMRVKILKGESTKEVEREINDFLADRNDIEVIDIKEVSSQRMYIFIVIYKKNRQDELNEAS
ncbi:MAG: hypothetical protein V4494_05420 [Chlamydiota bacterium]